MSLIGGIIILGVLINIFGLVGAIVALVFLYSLIK